jgi:hypothetical protein
MGICPDCENNEDIMICGTCGEQTCDHCHSICEQCKDIICVDCETRDFLCEKCLFKRKEETKNATNNTSDYSKQNITELINKEFCLMYFKDENARLKEENVKLKEENARLKQEVKKLNDCRTQYLDDMALDILEYFHDTNSIKETAKKYDMTIEETMINIVHWDGCSDGLQSAKDYKQCNLEVYGPDSDEEDESELEKDYLFSVK